MGGKICLRLMYHGITVLYKEHASIVPSVFAGGSQSSKYRVDGGSKLL